ncbi:MAG: cell surface protein, partial [Deltaproteobacteria bacterium]|nr:cell surface protein [Deltaproteobacteria bacterium]
FPQIVLGAPHGSGANVGSFDVLSLGAGGSIVLKSVTPILNLAGPDFIVFENAFYAGGNPLTPFAEPAEVSVSSDGVDFHPFPCAFDQPENLYPGCAGVHPVYANPDLNLINPLNPLTAGGEAYDLEDLAIQWVYYIKIEDKSTSGGGSSAGFDLDAVSIIHQ